MAMSPTSVRASGHGWTASTRGYPAGHRAGAHAERAHQRPGHSRRTIQRRLRGQRARAGGGVSETATGETHAFLWQAGRMRDLGTLGGGFSDARGINDRGQIVGISETASGDSAPSPGPAAS